jgi:hypothetical protein
MAYRVFKCAIRSCKYVFKDGSFGYFIEGRLTTDNEEHIAELEAEIKAKHPTIFIDEKDSVAETAQLDPMAALKKKIIAEYEASKASAPAGVDAGNSDKSAGAGTGLGNSLTAGIAAAKSASK